MIEWIILILLIIIFTIRNLKRGYFWKDRKGNKLSLKQFFSQWKKGVEGITPKQQALTSLWGYPLIIGGTITGIIINIINHLWWLLIILCGSLPIILMGLVSLYQKYQSLKKIEETMKNLNNPVRLKGGKLTK